MIIVILTILSFFFSHRTGIELKIFKACFSPEKKNLGNKKDDA